MMQRRFHAKVTKHGKTEQCQLTVVFRATDFADILELGLPDTT